MPERSGRRDIKEHECARLYVRTFVRAVVSLTEDLVRSLRTEVFGRLLFRVAGVKFLENKTPWKNFTQGIHIHGRLRPIATQRESSEHSSNVY